MGGPPRLFGTVARCASVGQAALAIGRCGALSPRSDNSCAPIAGRAAGWLRDDREDFARVEGGLVQSR